MLANYSHGGELNMHSFPSCHTALSLIAAFNFQLLRMCYGVKRIVRERHEIRDQRISYDHPDCWQGKTFNCAQNVNEILRAQNDNVICFARMMTS